MIAEKLRKAVLQAAMEGKLTDNNPGDSNVDDMILEIETEKEKLLSTGNIKKDSINKYTKIEDVPFDVPDKWVWTQLGYVTDYGKNRQVTVNTIEKGSLIIELEDIEKNTNKLISKKYNRKVLSSKNEFKKNDVLYGKLRPYLKKVIIADEPGYCSTEIVPFSGYKNILSKYLMYYMQTPAIETLVNSSTHGMDMPRLGTPKAQALPFALPPIEEQKRIVEKLEVLLAEINKLEKDEKALKDLEGKFPEKLKNAILRNAVSGKLTNQNLEVETTEDIIVLLEKKKNEKIEVIESYNKQPFDIPENWRWIKIGDLGTMGMGQTLLKKDMVEKGDPVYSATISDDPLGYVNKDNNKLKLTKGDFVIPARGASIGYVNLIKVDEASSTQTTMYIKSYLPSISNYIYYCLLGMKKDVFTTTGTAQPQITVGLTKEQLIPLPPLEEQKRIVEKLDELFRIDLLNM